MRCWVVAVCLQLARCKYKLDYAHRWTQHIDCSCSFSWLVREQPFSKVLFVCDNDDSVTMFICSYVTGWLFREYEWRTSTMCDDARQQPWERAHLSSMHRWWWTQLETETSTHTTTKTSLHMVFSNEILILLNIVFWVTRDLTQLYE